MDSPRPVIEADELLRVYGRGSTEVHALRGVNFVIREGEFVSIMGPSGSGKSTLLHLLGCLDKPTGGRLLLDEEDVAGHDDRAMSAVRNRKIGFVFQSYNLIQQLDVLGNVELPLLYARISREERRARAREAAELVELGDRLDHRPNELSGGQCQRVAIARALVTRPRFLLADEPTGNLDSVTGEAILALFQALNRAGITIVMVTHDGHVVAHTSRLLRLHDGLLVDDRAVAHPTQIEIPDDRLAGIRRFWQREETS